MTRDEWQKIERSRKILGLGESATLGEIKKAFRKLSKKHHPDVQRKSAADGDNAMQELVAAYEILLDYCARYRFPLVCGEDEPLEGKDWWMERFGDDPLWGPGRKKES